MNSLTSPSVIPATPETSTKNLPFYAPACQRAFTTLHELSALGVQVSARAVDITTQTTLLSFDDHVVMPTASIGKVLLLIEVAAQIEHGTLNPTTILERQVQDSGGKSGIWAHLHLPELCVTDLATLVGSVNDNLASNVLLRHVGLRAISERTKMLGLNRTALLDLVRDHRGPDDAPHLSIGSARELTALFAALAQRTVVSETVSEQVLKWINLNSDLSLVSGAFGLDPHSHGTRDHGVLVVNKTGNDPGVRSEAGIVYGPRAAVAFTVATYFNDKNLPIRLGVIEGMRTVGVDLLEYIF